VDVDSAAVGGGISAVDPKELAGRDETDMGLVRKRTIQAVGVFHRVRALEAFAKDLALGDSFCVVESLVDEESGRAILGII